MLTDYLACEEIATKKSTISNKGKKIKRPGQIPQFCSLLYSDHKEADHGIASHAVYASDNDNNENSSINIPVDDTDLYSFD